MSALKVSFFKPWKITGCELEFKNCGEFLGGYTRLCFCHAVN